MLFYSKAFQEYGSWSSYSKITEMNVSCFMYSAIWKRMKSHWGLQVNFPSLPDNFIKPPYLQWGSSICSSQQRGPSMISLQSMVPDVMAAMHPNSQSEKSTGKGPASIQFLSNELQEHNSCLFLFFRALLEEIRIPERTGPPPFAIMAHSTWVGEHFMDLPTPAFCLPGLQCYYLVPSPQLLLNLQQRSSNCNLPSGCDPLLIFNWLYPLTDTNIRIIFHTLTPTRKHDSLH